MVAAAIASRPASQLAPTPLRRSQRSAGTWVIIGVPVLLALVFLVAARHYVAIKDYSSLSYSRIARLLRRIAFSFVM